MCPTKLELQRFIAHHIGWPLIGLAIGLILAGISSHLLEGFLFGIPPIDPLTCAGTSVLFAAVGL